MGIVLERRIFLLRPQNSFLSLHETPKTPLHERADNVSGNHRHMTGCGTPYFDKLLKCGVLPFEGSDEDILALMLAYNGEFYEHKAVEDFDAIRARYEVFNEPDAKCKETAYQLGRILIGGPVRSKTHASEVMRNKQYLGYISDLRWFSDNKFIGESILRYFVHDLKSENGKIEEIRRFMADKGWPCEITSDDQQVVDKVMADFEPGELVRMPDEFLLICDRQREWSRS